MNRRRSSKTALPHLFFAVAPFAPLKRRAAAPPADLAPARQPAHPSALPNFQTPLSRRTNSTAEFGKSDESDSGAHPFSLRAPRSHTSTLPHTGGDACATARERQSPDWPALWQAAAVPSAFSLQPHTSTRPHFHREAIDND